MVAKSEQSFYCKERRLLTFAGFLFVFSLFFYAWWDPSLLVILISSILFNFTIGKFVFNNKRLTIFAITMNLLALIYYKYTNFLTLLLTDVGILSSPTSIILPLAISFFTFQQVAYIVDSYKGVVKEHNFLNYCLFVTFFPQLIAGPIVHHKEMMPQFNKGVYFSTDGVLFGICLFLIGLFKKVILADGIAQYANPVFDAADSGALLTSLEAWGGALAYTFQLYFDFSGYADMAIGIAACFGITLPDNFNSPYKSFSISEFWRKWHITLGNFLRDYLYIPLGGNRCAKNRQIFNLFMTMFLGGIWHGAGWNFMIWGALHGMYLGVNHSWKSSSLRNKINFHIAYKLLAWMITFIAVVIAWVFFRSETIEGAIAVLSAMFQINNVHSESQTFNVHAWLWLMSLALIALFLPNSKKIAGGISSFKGRKANIAFGSVIVFYALLTLISSTSEYNEFIYFNF